MSYYFDQFSIYRALAKTTSGLIGLPNALHGYERIHCLLDNDEAGARAYQELRKEFSDRIRDFSHDYRGYKDLNDYLCGKRQNLIVNPPPRNIVKPKKKGLGL